MTESRPNPISVDEARTLDGLFARRVHRSPEDEAYRVYDRRSKTWRSYSWRRMAEEVARWQNALRGEGLLPGDRVAVLLRNCPEWVMFDQAALSLGLVVVPLYTDDRAENVAYILRDAGVSLLLVQDAGRWNRLSSAMDKGDSLRRVLLLEGRVDEPDERVRSVKDWLAPSGAPFHTRVGDPDALASIVYTSGTTGPPKGVMLSHRNMLWVAAAALGLVDVYSKDVFLSFLPLSHTLERSHGYYMPMMAGAAVVFARSVTQLAEDLAKQRPTVLITVPRVFERVHARLQHKLHKGSPLARLLFQSAVDVGWRRFEWRQGRAAWSPALLIHPLLDVLVGRKVRRGLGGRLRACACGGAPLSQDVARLFIGLGIPILQGYGLTESSPLISVNTFRHNDPASVGIPLPGLEVTTGAEDELLVRGPNLMQGYWRNPSATADTVDEDGWLHTGDQARLANGHVYITGRIKDVLVLSNGEKVPPADMEMAIALDPLLEQVMVVGEGKAFLGAIVVVDTEQWASCARELGLNPDSDRSLSDEKAVAEVLRRIRHRLKGFPGYAKIRRVVLLREPWTIENGLITPTLKVKRQQVLHRYEPQLGAMYAESSR